MNQLLFYKEEITNEIIFKEFKNVNIDYSLGRLIVSYENHPKRLIQYLIIYLMVLIYILIVLQKKRMKNGYIFKQFIGDEFSDNSFDTGLSFEVFDLKIK